MSTVLAMLTVRPNKLMDENNFCRRMLRRKRRREYLSMVVGLNSKTQMPKSNLKEVVLWNLDFVASHSANSIPSPERLILLRIGWNVCSLSGKDVRFWDG